MSSDKQKITEQLHDMVDIVDARISELQKQKVFYTTAEKRIDTVTSVLEGIVQQLIDEETVTDRVASNPADS